ncbi:MAG: uncharacterized protein QOD12_615 [Verrucomicrobiota bacterium]|jgi:hypothetical protein
MAINPQENDTDTFVLSHRPLVPQSAPPASGTPADYENLGALPRSYGGSILFSIARDPHTLFVYWDIDWPAVFGDNPPADRKVHLRVLWHEGIEETTEPVEPLAGSHLISVAHARSSYRIELGYNEPADVWNSVATSDAVLTPPEDVGETSPIDVATVPFHLSFQRIVDAFRGSKYDGDAIVEILAEMQAHADKPGAALAEADREILRAIDLTFSETDALHRSRLRESDDAFATRQRIESILGFGASSPM